MTDKFRILIFSDIHANAISLNAIFSELDTRRFDEILFLGDAALFGPQPKEVLEFLRKINCVSIMGNAESWLLNGQKFEANKKDAREIFEINQWCANQLSEDGLSFFRKYQQPFETKIGDYSILFCHGSPTSNKEAILSSTGDVDMDRFTSKTQANIIVSGHTHVQMLRKYKTTTFINPGSVGCPTVRTQGKSAYFPYAEYAIITIENSELGVEFFRTHIDTKSIYQAAQKNKMPHYDWWFKRWMLS